MKDKADSTAGSLKRPLIFGEVLFDNFPDGHSVLGGAPFNVAWHLQGLGLAPLFISRVGNDSNGERVRRRMQQWGMDLSGLQLDQKHPTGQVSITLANGQPTFDIVPDQAYDYIETQAAIAAMSGLEPCLLYHGSLISRSEISRDSLINLGKRSIPSYVDINLREPWWTRSVIEAALYNARWAKLNDQEVVSVTNMSDIVKGAQELQTKYGLEWVIVTRGAKGAFLCSEAGITEVEPVNVENIVDTVGAGDGFSAITLLGIIDGWSAEKILKRAACFAAEICKVRGATVNDIQFYQDFISGCVDSP